MNFWQDKRTLVTGGSGFLGTHLIAKLRAAGADVFAPTHKECDLCQPGDLYRLIKQSGGSLFPIVFHLAAFVGGIGRNMQQPAEMVNYNLHINLNVLWTAQSLEMGKFITVGSVCMYPKWSPTPFVEENLWEGYPEETNAPYGVAKRALLVQLQAMRRQYGFNGVMLIPTNLYGPGDHSDHVIADLIPRLLKAQAEHAPSVTVWGSGKATRDFLYVDDCAEALMLAGEWYNAAEPVNLGSGTEMSIFGLVCLLKRLTGYEGDIIWDVTKPDGQPRRVLNSSRAWNAFGWKASTKLEDGLVRTVDWWRGELCKCQ